MTRATIKDGEFQFESVLARHRFLKLAEGKEVRLEVVDKPTSEMRRYFEGCLVPAFFYFHPRSGWKTFTDAREVIKLEFSPGAHLVMNLEGEYTKIAQSTTNMSKGRFSLMVESLTGWFIENGMPADVLDPDEYKRWRDSIPDEDLYPPLKRLKEAYEHEI